MNTKNEVQNEVLAELPKVPGLALRRYRNPDDFIALANLFNLANTVDGVQESISAKEMEYNYTTLKDFDIDRDMLLVEVDGEIVAYGRASHREEAEERRVYFAWGVVHPAWRRRGLGRFLLQQNEARLRQIATGHPDDKQKMLMVETGDMQVGATILARKTSYREDRHFFLMLRELSEPIPAADLPQGLELLPSTRAQFRAIWEAMDEAFRDHWGYSPGTEEDYQRFANHPNRDPRLWQVAWEGDQVAGMVLNDIRAEENKQLGLKWGWTDPICVRLPWRRRGLARNLINKSLELLRAEGMQQAVLGVDTLNPSGALKLYESCGYHQHEHWTVYVKGIDHE
jgi:ribosomal protein S18 acetylase RimI-like enzyme